MKDFSWYRNVKFAFQLLAKYKKSFTWILYSSCGRQSTRSTQPNKQPVGYVSGNLQFPK